MNPTFVQHAFSHILSFEMVRLILSDSIFLAVFLYICGPHLRCSGKVSCPISSEFNLNPSPEFPDANQLTKPQLWAAVRETLLEWRIDNSGLA